MRRFNHQRVVNDPRRGIVGNVDIVGIAGRMVAPGLSAFMLLSGCVSTQVSDFDGFVSIPMNRVVPFPPAEELGEGTYEVVLVERDSQSFEDSKRSDSSRRVGRKLRRLVRDAGATIVAQTEAQAAEPNGESMEADLDDVDFVLAVRVDTYQATGTWEPPFKFLWQTPEEVAASEGTCTHRAEISFEVEVLEGQDSRRRAALYILSHATQFKSKGLDETCPLARSDRNNLFEQTLDDSLSCLRTPLEDLLAPRGHVLAHRVQRETGRQLYQISLGSEQKLQTGSKVEIRREQHLSTPEGDSWRTQRVISRGVVTDHLAALDAWIAVDPNKSSEEILEGDVVRRVMTEGLLSSLSGPNCKKILSHR